MTMIATATKGTVKTGIVTVGFNPADNIYEAIVVTAKGSKRMSDTDLLILRKQVAGEMVGAEKTVANAFRGFVQNLRGLLRSTLMQTRLYLKATRKKKVAKTGAAKKGVAKKGVAKKMVKKVVKKAAPADDDED